MAYYATYMPDENGVLHKVVINAGVGFVLPYYGETAPPGTLACDGSEISRTVYDELFQVLGTKAGAGDGTSTFNLPDFRGRFIRGTGGNAAELGVEQSDAIRDITGHFAISGTSESVPGSGPMGFPAYWVDGAFAARVDPISKTCLPSSVRAVPAGTSGLYAGVDFHASNVVDTDVENRPVNVALLWCIIYE